MPWKRESVMDQRAKFVFEALAGENSVTALCVLYGISRKTGYKWIARYRQGGLAALESQSRRPKHTPTATPPEVVECLLAAKEKYPNWGPKKLVRVLARKYDVVSPPAPSTAGNILKREGLVKARQRRATKHPKTPCRRIPAEMPNDVWCVDYKGWFRLGNGKLCYPLTVSDLFTRYVLCCDCHDRPTYQNSYDSFNVLFNKYGLPQVIRVDNGAPFASSGLGRFSKLSAYWHHLGITVDFMDLGKPQQNGAHERMHRTLKQEATIPPAKTILSQQKIINRWMKEYNKERPHEALEFKTPAASYTKSHKKLPSTLTPYSYPPHYEVRAVKRSGEMKFNGCELFVGRAFGKELLGLVQNKKLEWMVFLGQTLLGIICPRSFSKVVPVNEVM